MYRVEKSFNLHAAHRLPYHAGACARLHGHTYRVVLICEAEELQDEGSQAGMVVDFGTLKEAFQCCEADLDHSVLNETEGLENPTAENLARWIYEAMKPMVSELVEVAVWETPTSRASYRR